ncbi:hypothetical protein H9P43_009342 [Blastocladiella emersonii ATCC 22665]|nr:hypothetical protein H9P43_009342 [Blastocladiella emersonii ATCC 22665]
MKQPLLVILAALALAATAHPAPLSTNTNPLAVVASAASDLLIGVAPTCDASACPAGYRCDTFSMFGADLGLCVPFDDLTCACPDGDGAERESVKLCNDGKTVSKPVCIRRGGACQRVQSACPFECPADACGAAREPTACPVGSASTTTCQWIWWDQQCRWTETGCIKSSDNDSFANAEIQVAGVTASSSSSAATSATEDCTESTTTTMAYAPPTKTADCEGETPTTDAGGDVAGTIVIVPPPRPTSTSTSSRPASTSSTRRTTTSTTTSARPTATTARPTTSTTSSRPTATPTPVPNPCKRAPCNPFYCVGPDDFFPMDCRTPNGPRDTCHLRYAVCAPQPSLRGQCGFAFPPAFDECVRQQQR